MSPARFLCATPLSDTVLPRKGLFECSDAGKSRGGAGIDFSGGLKGEECDAVGSDLNLSAPPRNPLEHFGHFHLFFACFFSQNR